MLSRGRLPCGLIPAIDAATSAFWNLGNSFSSGPRPTSILRDDIGIEAVFEQHHAAAQHLEDALRDAVKERLAVVLGRRKGRPIDLETLRQLPASELIQACHQARLPTPPGLQPQWLAAALHAWLHPPEARRAAGTTAQSGSAEPSRGWDRPASLRESNWVRQSGLGAASAAASAAGGAARQGATGSASEPTAAKQAARAVGGGAAEAAAAGMTMADSEATEAAAEAALREAAEREADALFDEELRRRLQAAAGNAAVAAAAEPEPVAVGAGAAATAAPASPLAAEDPPQPRPAQHEPQQPQKEQAAARDSAGFMSTTELLAAAAGPSGGGESYVTSRSGSTTNEGSYNGPTGGDAGVHGGGGGGADGESLFDSLPPATGPPRPSEVAAAVRRSLGRAGYDRSRDPTALRALLLLSRAELRRLVETFSSGGDGGVLLDTAGQSAEQLAVRLLHMMQEQGPTTARAGSSSSGSSSGATGAGTTPPQQLQAASGVREGGVRLDRRRVVHWREQEESEEGEAGGGRWDEERAALGDPRRRAVLAAARRRQQLLAAAARPEEVATWLVKARAQDVVLLCSDPDADLDWDLAPDSGASSIGSGSLQSDSEAVGGGASYMVLATALSQRHAYACAEAVRYQIRERLEELVVSGSGSGSTSGLNTVVSGLDDDAVRCAPSVSGFNGADWLSLEAGRVQVHVLTPQARRYYRLEELLTGTAATAATRMGANDGGSKGSYMGAGGHAADGRPAGRWEHAGGSPSSSSSAAGAGAAGGAGTRSARPRMRLFGPWAGGEGVSGGGRLPDTLETARVDTKTTAASRP